MGLVGLAVAVAMIGGAGAVLRFVIDGWLERDRLAAFPVGTLAINLSGSLLLGLLVGAEVGGDALLLSGTAALGSFTTFSTWVLESQRLAEDGAIPLAALNLVLSLAGGLALLSLGWALGSVL